MTSLLWFRKDLRLADNPALTAAVSAGMPIIPVYLHAPEEEAEWRPGGASCWWLHQSLARLEQELRHLGSRLILRDCRDQGSLAQLLDIARHSGATHVFWNRRYEAPVLARDKHIKTALRETGLEAASFNAALLHEPWEIHNKAGAPFQVFSPYWRQSLSLPDPQAPLAAPAQLPAPRGWPVSCHLDELRLLPTVPWAAGLQEAWTPGSAGAQAALQRFIRGAQDDYASARDRPDIEGTSRLSPHLHHGEIGPREVWSAVRTAALNHGQHSSWRQSRFLTEIGWREFAYHLIYHFPQTARQPLRSNFRQFAWRSDAHALHAWQRGATGYPIVDAGMRQLWASGWMHNRVRMIVGSFLVKHLLLPWTAGADWFWDTLVDADLANNTLGWQWVAGCGADAAPYFRIFNPTAQAQRFDPRGAYVKAWLPALARMPEQWIHEPWKAPPPVLAAAAVELGGNYPHRIIEHGAARARALAAFAALKTKADA